MPMTIFILVGIGTIVVYLIVAVTRAYLKLRGKRLIVCPETKAPAAVELDAARAAVGSVLYEKRLQLKECSRWPESQDCDQRCLEQIEAAPENCLVRKIAADWYAGKSCAICRRPFGEIHWADHQPALMNSRRQTVQWNQVKAETLPEMLSTLLPVCWNCHVVETFRRQYPQLVIERPSDAAQIRHKIQ